jgi:hypothetical protein
MKISLTSSTRLKLRFAFKMKPEKLTRATWHGSLLLIFRKCTKSCKFL